MSRRSVPCPRALLHIRHVRLPLLAAALLLLAAHPALSSCSSIGRPGSPQAISVALPGLEQGALIYVADHQGFFAANGLTVTIKSYDSGVSALDAMLKGEADLAEAAEFPFVAAVFQQAQLRVVASNDRFENDYIAARKDRGIATPPDLAHKRIGVARQSIAEFYLARYLALSGVPLQDVTLVDLKPDQFVAALVSGDVDAIIAWQPYVSRMQREVQGIVVWPAQSGQAAYSVLAGDATWLAGHPDTARRFLKSLAEAEDYVAGHQDESRAIVQKRLGYDGAYVTSVWPQHRFILSLDLSLIVAMDDEAHWMADNLRTTAAQPPDLMNFVYSDALRAVKPEAVTISR